jgi:peptidoglycan-associated lipoprotein
MEWGITMKASLGKCVLVAALGLTVVSMSGCGMKWLQSDGDETGGSRGSGWQGQGVNPDFPAMTQGQSGNELSGFSQNPSDEYLSHGSGFASVSPANSGMRHHAELSREEQAAAEAGLKDVFFGYDQWTLSDSGMEALNHNAKWLKAHPGSVLKVEGHCDERGTTDYNMVLGDKRSKSARSYLTEMGVSPKQVGIVSYGKERPFCSEHDESCYQLNRRGHVLLKRK